MSRDGKAYFTQKGEKILNRLFNALKRAIVKKSISQEISLLKKLLIFKLDFLIKRKMYTFFSEN